MHHSTCSMLAQRVEHSIQYTAEGGSTQAVVLSGQLLCARGLTYAIVPSMRYQVPLHYRFIAPNGTVDWTDTRMAWYTWTNTRQDALFRTPCW